jgi:N-acetylglucosamine-6-phosphate deacetylase
MTGYVDIQLNGYYGVDFNRDTLTAEQFHFACEKLQAAGVRAFVPTIITASIPHMCACFANLARIVAADPLARRMAPAFHAEGPFISNEAGYRGAHPAQHAHPASLEEARQLVDAAGGLLRLVTLAPERDAGFAVTRWLAGQGVRVAAGHANPSLSDLQGAADAGLSLYTHLGNGVPMQVHRHDNIVQRVLSLRDRITPCFIADGVHIPLFALGNYLALAGTDRAVVVTDGVDVAGLGPGRFRTLQGDEVVVGEELAVWSADRTHLCGSASTMPQLEANLRTLGFSDRQLRQLLCENPARALGLQL